MIMNSKAVKLLFLFVIFALNCLLISALPTDKLRRAAAPDNGDDDTVETDADADNGEQHDHNGDEELNGDANEEDSDPELVSESPDEPQDGSKLLIILVDGFRYDYVQKDRRLKGFARMASSGVRAEYVRPVFPANSYPNWYSIATGLYAESHGIVGNYMYDRGRDDFFLMAPHPNASHQHWWNQSEPIWITAERQGAKAAVYLWDGCQVRIRGRRPSVCHEYRALYDSVAVVNETKLILDEILEQFREDKYRLAMVYYEFVDYSGHRYGPLTSKTKQAVRDIDTILDDLMGDIKEKELQDELNVVVVSDHGMIRADDATVIHIEEILDFNDVDVFLGGGSSAQILPEEGKEDAVYEQLTNANARGLNVYRKAKIPDRFHLKDNSLVLPILITADKDYLIKPPDIKAKVYPAVKSGGGQTKGFHGYDPDHVIEMRTIMYAFGPAFRTNYTSKPLEQVDHYNLFCRLLDIEPNPNNGSESRIEKLLKEAESLELSDDSVEDDGEDEDDDDDDDDSGVSASEPHSALVYAFLILVCQRLYV